MKKIKFTKKELLHLLSATLVLGFVFSFQEWGTTSFDLTIGLTNLFMAILAAFLALILHELAHKIIAKKQGATTEFRVWSIQRIWFKKTFKRKIPIGIIFPLFFVFLSNGKITLATTETSKIDENPLYRTRKKFPHLTNLETAFIALSGPLASLFLALLVKSFSPTDPFFLKFVMLNFWIAGSSMLPFPNLDGLKIAMGSLPLYILSSVFMLTCIFVTSYLNLILTIFLALIVSIALSLLYLYTAK